MKVLAKRIKPLYQVDEYTMLIWHKGKIGLCDLKTGKITNEIRVATRSQRLLAAFRITERLFRLEPRGAEAITDHVFIFSFCGTAYKVDFTSDTLVQEQIFSEEMSNPLSFARIKDIDTFRDSIAYGEYKANDGKMPVAVYTRSLESDGYWEKVYQFEKGKINHIHALIPDKYRNVVYILTGDDDESSGIWVARNDWKTVEPLLLGKQEYRSCFALAEQKGLTFVTDTPFQRNAIYFLDLTSSKLQPPVKLKEISGSCIYGTFWKSNLLFSTTVEPDANIKSYRYLFTKQRGAGILDDKVHIYYGNNQNGYREIYAVKKDGFPMGLMQFGSVQYPVNSFPRFHKAYGYFAATKKTDGKWGKFNV